MKNKNERPGILIKHEWPDAGKLQKSIAQQLSEAQENIQALQERVDAYETSARLIRSTYANSRSPVAKRVIAELNRAMRFRS